MISRLLSNKKYIGTMVSFEEYFVAQGEKGNRSDIDEDTKQRKASQYSSQSSATKTGTTSTVRRTASVQNVLRRLSRET